MAWLSERRPVFPGPDALLPVVVTDSADGTLLMLGWANADALAATERSGEAHFWSRSRAELWHKGATSGNRMTIVGLGVDCDGDAIEYRVRPSGAACHLGSRSCFDQAAESPEPIEAPAKPEPFDLAALEALIGARRDAPPEASYTARLLAGGPRRPAEKVIEEAGELAVAALTASEDEARAEAADLLYHTLVLLAARGIALREVVALLAERHAERRSA